MNPKRGEIYLLKRDAAGKQRPVVVVSNDILNHGNTVLVVPFYSQQLEKRATQAWCAMFQQGEGGLERDCAAKADQITLVDKLEIDLASGVVGRFNDLQMERLVRAIKWSLSIP